MVSPSRNGTRLWKRGYGTPKQLLGSFNLVVFLYPSAGAVDYIREMVDNRRGGAYIRVIPRPLGGSTITMTVPIGPGANESDVAKTLEQELSALVHLVHR